MKNGPIDVAIIGGGPAGLQAALVLARTRKQIIVFDDPQPPRNSASHGVHNLLGLDGLPPMAIRDLAWQQIATYHSTEPRHEQVTSIQRGEADNFLVVSEQGIAVWARHVILACGYRDVYPDIPGFAECWADTVIPCPYCDGYENRDRVWGVVASSESTAQHFPKLVQNWTSDVKLLLQPGVVLDTGYRDSLLAAGISIHSGSISHIHHTGGKVEAVALGTGETIRLGTLLWVPPTEPLPLVKALVGNLGLETDSAGYVKTNEAQQTNIPNLWAAGDVQHGRWALDAVSTGGKAAQMIIKTWYS
ncbi:MAG: NAD(P)/FAD-dependent oxidoreductase [Anaerolineales bacterium]